MTIVKVFVLALAVSLTACGGSKSSKIARAMMGGMQASQQKQGGGNGALFRQVKEQAEATAWIAYFNVPTHPKAPECVNGSIHFGDSKIRCSASCGEDAMSHFISSCDTLDKFEYSCGGDRFSWSNGHMAFDMTSANGTTLTSTPGRTSLGAMSFSMSMTGDFTGGSLEGHLDCRLSISIDPSQMQNSSAKSQVDCGGFSCSLNGEAMKCEDFQSLSSEETTCS